MDASHTDLTPSAQLLGSLSSDRPARPRHAQSYARRVPLGARAGLRGRKFAPSSLATRNIYHPFTQVGAALESRGS